MKTKEEILSKITGMTVSDDMIRMQTEISYILQAMDEYAQEKLNNFNLHISDCFASDREIANIAIIYSDDDQHAEELFNGYFNGYKEAQEHIKYKLNNHYRKQ